MRFLTAVTWALLAAASLAAQSNVGKELDDSLTMLEHEFVPLAEAMPADKYGFAPSPSLGEFKNARTFGQQASHVAAVIYMVAAAALGEKNPSEPSANENGPASLKTKDDIVNYAKAAFAYGHKAMKSLNEKNMLQMAPSPWGSDKVTRFSIANTAIWHSFDHYGQMAVYARMNGVIPPASRR